MNSHQPQSTEPPRIAMARPRPWMKVFITGGVALAAFLTMAVLAMIDGITGISLKGVAMYFGYLFFLAGFLTVIFAIIAGFQVFLSSDRHKYAKAQMK